MAKTYNTSKSNTKSVGVDHNTTRSNRATSVGDGGGGGPDEAQGADYHTTRSNNTQVDTGGGGPEKSGAVDHNTTRSNRATSIGGGGGTTGMKSTLGLI
ncbi:MAG TPA: hypothetical protein EYQ70_03635, partial [Marine Group III euryarchaeote]|nr:hypothetical protein [Marine Group III euryarchaeote]